MTDTNDWSLTSEQAAFIQQHETFIAYALSDKSSTSDIEKLLELAGTEAYRNLFEGMSLDEAWDRYVSMEDKV